MLRHEEVESRIDGKEELDSTDSEIEYALKNGDEEFNSEEFILRLFYSKPKMSLDYLRFPIVSGIARIRGREYLFARLHAFYSDE